MGTYVALVPILAVGRAQRNACRKDAADGSREGAGQGEVNNHRQSLDNHSILFRALPRF
jgi:hypothetical protein